MQRSPYIGHIKIYYDHSLVDLLERMVKMLMVTTEAIVAEKPSDGAVVDC